MLFKDTCTKEWAMNTTTQSRPVNAATARDVNQGEPRRRRGPLQGQLQRRMGEEPRRSAGLSDPLNANGKQQRQEPRLTPGFLFLRE